MLHNYIPYGRQFIDESDITEVIETLKSSYLTTGPKVEQFENAVANYVGAKYAVAVSSGTAALHAAMYAADIHEGDEVILSPMTFAATANVIVYQRGIPVFVDVDPDTLLLDPSKIEEKITSSTKAIITVDYAGQPSDYDTLAEIAKHHKLTLIADSCHSLGGRYKNKPVGSLASLSVFSFHPVKHITTGEGGMVTTNDENFANRMRIFRNHGIDTDYHQRDLIGSWYYQIEDIGYNYRITDFQCALGSSQLKKLPDFIDKRQKIASIYHSKFQQSGLIQPLQVKPDRVHVYHLYVIRIAAPDIQQQKQELFKELHKRGIGVNVHYIPVYLHPFYRKKFNYTEGLCPVAEDAYHKIISLPIFPHLSVADQEYICNTVLDVCHNIFDN